MTDITRTHLGLTGHPLCGRYADGDRFTDDPDAADCNDCLILHRARARLAARAGIPIGDIPVTTIHVCGPSRPRCKCRCPDGPCEHVWDGPWWESEDGTEGSATCSRCGMLASDHDLWVAP